MFYGREERTWIDDGYRDEYGDDEYENQGWVSSSGFSSSHEQTARELRKLARSRRKLERRLRQDEKRAVAREVARQRQTDIALDRHQRQAIAWAVQDQKRVVRQDRRSNHSLGHLEMFNGNIV